MRKYNTHKHIPCPSSPHTAAHTKPSKPLASRWLRLYRHCIAGLSLSHPVHGNRGEALLSEREHMSTPLLVEPRIAYTHTHTR